ncbi:MAG: glycosyltransferase [Kiritimatiellales bacterium]
MNTKVIANLTPAHFDHEYDYFTFEKIRMHDRSKYRFILIYLQQKSDLPNQMETDGFPCFYLFQKHQKVRLISAVFKLLKILKENRVDLIHAHNRVCIVCAVWAAVFLTHVKVLAHVHSFNLVRKPKRKLFYRLLGRRIDCLAGCSDSVTTSVKTKISGIAPEKFTTIPNSINIERYSTPTAERQTVRAEWNFAPEHFVFLGLGRLAEEKGFDCLIRAFKPVYEQHPNARLLIAGEGPERNRLTELIQTLELQSAVFLAGFRKDAPNLLHAADCFVLSSLKEPFGLVVLEAIAARCPVIAADSGGVRNILSSPMFGTLVQPADEKQMTSAMLRILKAPPEQLKKQSEAALAVFETFSHKSAVCFTESLYEKLTGA